MTEIKVEHRLVSKRTEPLSADDEEFMVRWLNHKLRQQQQRMFADVLGPAFGDEPIIEGKADPVAPPLLGKVDGDA